MPRVDLDFQRYIERRRGALEAQTREGAAYAYGGDLRALRTLERLRPVRLALDAAGRLWTGSARDQLLGEATRASHTRDPERYAALAHACEQLHVATPALYVTPDEAPFARTFGSNEDAYLVLSRGLVDKLSPAETAFVLGRECGHIQNNHVLYATALHYLTHRGSGFVRWIVSPARLALEAWWRRALVTADRAGLLCARDLDVAQAALAKLALPTELARRAASLAVFGESAYYRGVLGLPGGLSAGECDAQVAGIWK